MPTLRREIPAMLRLALPLVLSFLGMMAMGVVDTAMMGHSSMSLGMPAVALGNGYFFLLSHFGMGILLALDPLVSQALGARDDASVARNLQRGLILALLLSLPVIACLLPVEPALHLLGQPESLIPVASSYVRIVSGSLPAFYLFVVLRSTLQAMHRLGAVALVIVLGNLLNLLFNWLLIEGQLGFPRLGADGCAISSVSCRWFMAVALLGAAWKPLRIYLRGSWRAALEPGALWRLTRLGMPVGLQLALEIGFFNAMMLMMGWIGEDAVGGHQIALTLASVSFMVPLGIASAAAVRVGHGVGRGDPPAVRASAVTAILLGGGAMALASLVLLFYPSPLAAAISKEAAHVEVGLLLIPMAAAFQVFDGLQVVASGILRGMADTFVPMLIHLGSFWIFGIPFAYLLGFTLGFGPEGLWWGVVAALAMVALVALLRVRRLLAELPRRVTLEQADLAAPHSLETGQL